MLAVFDIGNSNVTVGCFKGEELLFEMRLRTEPGRTIDELWVLLDSMFVRKLGAGYKISACIISSVVPVVTPDFVRLVREMLGLEAVVVGPGVKTGLALKVHEPAAVGADRVVNAVAAKGVYGSPSLVIDFGTATTFDYVGRDGDFEGGMICAGIGGVMESLVKNTAKLPRIDIVWPKSVLGKNTVLAMQAGVVVGYACMIEGLIEKLVAETGPIDHIVATGGLGRVISEHSSRIKTYDSHLTLKGLRILAHLNGLE